MGIEAVMRMSGRAVGAWGGICWCLTTNMKIFPAYSYDCLVFVYEQVAEPENLQ